MKENKLTPNRRTHVYIDETRHFPVESQFSHQRFADEQGRGDASHKTGVHFWKGIGWIVADKLRNIRTIIEEETLTPTPGSVPALFTSVKRRRKPTNTEFPNMNAGSLFAATSAPMIQKNVSAGVNWDSTHSADLTAFSQPEPIDDHVPMDRVYISDSNDTINGSVLVMLSANGATLEYPDKVLTFYFNASAGRNQQGTGNGQYALTLSGYGDCTLYERKASDLTWMIRKKFRWEGMRSISNRSFFIYILKENRVGYSTLGNGLISFTFAFAGETFDDPEDFTMEKFIPVMNPISVSTGASQTTTYVVPRTTKLKPSTTLTKNRLDIRRDLRYGFNLYRGSFNQTGTLIDSPFNVLQPFTDDSIPLILEWDAEEPSGTSVSLDLYNADTDTIISPDTTSGHVKTYTPTFAMRRFYVKATLVGSTSGTPVYKSFVLTRDGRAKTVTGDGIELLGLRRVDIRGQERDPTQETAKVIVSNPLQPAILDILDNRGSIPIRIETEYDPADSSKRCVLFQGFAERSDAIRKGYGHGDKGLAGGTSQATGYPAQNWKEYTLTCNGEWQRLDESLTMIRQAFWETPDNLPVKFSVLVDTLVSYGGYPTGERDIPDNDIRMFLGQNSKEALIEPASPVYKTIKDILETYTGQFLTYDRNDGTDGKWRLLDPPVPPYTNVAAFTSDKPTGLKIFSTISYPNATTGGGLTYAANSPTTPIIKGSYRTWVKRPKVNMVFVCSLASVLPIPHAIWSRAVNMDSFEFHDSHVVDKTNPDFLGRIIPMIVVIPNLAVFGNDEEAQGACDWVCRRIFDIHATSRKMRSFEAPLVLIPHENDSSKRRPLRYYDPVTIDGAQFLIRNCNPNYTKDHVQTAIYEVEEPR